MRLIFPDAIGLRSNFPHAILGKVTSTAYRAAPLTLVSPSTLGVGLPTTCFDDAIARPPATYKIVALSRCRLRIHRNSPVSEHAASLPSWAAAWTKINTK